MSEFSSPSVYVSEGERSSREARRVDRRYRTELSVNVKLPTGRAASILPALKSRRPELNFASAVALSMAGRLESLAVGPCGAAIAGVAQLSAVASATYAPRLVKPLQVVREEVFRIAGGTGR